MSDPLEARVVELEIRLAHQDDMLQALNRTVVEQQQVIQQMQIQMENLRLRLAEVLQAPSGDPSQEPPPPHY